MYAGHFAAGLAIKVAEPRASMAAVLGLVFLPDLLWLGFSVGGLELVGPGLWFDGWSHSIASIILQAVVVGMLWWRQGIGVAAALACAVLSHLILDLPIHPAPLELYPHATAGIGDFLHGWAGHAALFGKTNGWWIEAAIVVCGVSIYLAGSRRAGVDKAIASAAAILVAWLHVAFG
jgi:hypothetical protein